MTEQQSAKDTFQLYDLRVEVICPSRERILCGAKEGDYFLLQGEMLHLPPGQGFSIYSLGKSFRPTTYSGWSDSTGLTAQWSTRCHLASVGSEAEANACERLDDNRHRNCVSRSALQVTVEDHKDGVENFQPCRGHCSSIARSGSKLKDKF